MRLIAVAGYVKEIAVAPGVREPGLVMPHRYLDCAIRAGAACVVLPYRAPLPAVDGLVLVGGGDVEPALYGAQCEEETAGVDDDRDATEIALAREALRRDIPILAICRGAQVLNVAMGGTLRQHVSGHREAPGSGLKRRIEADPISRIGAACGSSFVGWCSHHQAVDRLGDGLRATAWASDGVLEGAETAEGWVVAVQWHPERTADEDATQQAIFDAFVAAASR